MRSGGHRVIGAVFALVVVSGATDAVAQSSIYTCRDQSGRTISSDHPLTDCAGVMRELSPSGVVKREIGPPLTPEQQRQKDADDRAKRLAAEAAREQHRRDLALLTAYQSEDQIEDARRRAQADASDSIKLSQTRLLDLEKEKKSLAQESETYKGKIPPLFQRRIDDNQALIDDEQASIKMRQADVERVNQRYDDEKKRFRELNSGRATANSGH
jgi:hypothetical protein